MIMSPVGFNTGRIAFEVCRQLANWVNEAGTGVDFGTGFTPPDESILSPDAAWLLHEQWKVGPGADRGRFGRICPEFVIEVKSKSDRIADVKAKMESWIDNGALLAWLIEPTTETTWILPSGSRARGGDRV